MNPSGSPRRLRRLRRAVFLGLGKLYPLPGEASPLPSLVALVLILLLLQTASTAFDAVTDLIQSGAAWVGVPWQWSALAFPLLFAILWALARRGAAELAPRVEAEISPRPVRCLVLLLSLCAEGQRGVLATARGALADAADRPPPDGLAGHGWGAPVAAVAHHLGAGGRPGRLERVVVIGTGPTRRADGSEAPGSAAQIPAFRDLLHRLADADGHRLGDPARPGGALRVETAAEALGAEAPRRCRDLDGREVPFDAAGGIGMENLEELATLLEALYRRLAREHGGEAEVLVDITGQGKTSAAAAVALAVLVPRRRFQYVTHDRRIIAYDVTVDLPEAPR